MSGLRCINLTHPPRQCHQVKLQIFINSFKPWSDLSRPLQRRRALPPLKLNQRGKFSGRVNNTFEAQNYLAVNG